MCSNIVCIVLIGFAIVNWDFSHLIRAFEGNVTKQIQESRIRNCHACPARRNILSISTCHSSYKYFMSQLDAHRCVSAMSDVSPHDAAGLWRSSVVKFDQIGALIHRNTRSFCVVVVWRRTLFDLDVFVSRELSGNLALFLAPRRRICSSVSSAAKDNILESRTRVHTHSISSVCRVMRKVLLLLLYKTASPLC